MSRFATGVTLLTTHLDGDPVGLTANSFTSVSLEPVLVLVSVQKSARFHAAVLETGLWGVSVLAAEHEELSRTFATKGRPQAADQFAPWPHRMGPETSCVLLTDALATFEVRTTAVHAGGDHTLLVGEVLSVGAPRPGGDPLLYHASRYRAFDGLDDPVR